MRYDIRMANEICITPESKSISRITHVSPAESRKANAFARRVGRGSATSITFGDEDKFLGYTRCGYRKTTTGEYVSNAYRAKFGWKNTYYQHAECDIQLRKLENPCSC